MKPHIGIVENDIIFISTLNIGYPSSKIDIHGYVDIFAKID